MSASLEPQASAVAEALRAFERALAGTMSQWNDSARHAFDQRYTEPALASGRKAASELADLARDLSSAISELDLVG
jgi:hypothetical protein